MGIAFEVYHKITLPNRKSRYSAWFDRSGFLVDCERIDIKGRAYECTKAEMSDLWSGPWSSKQHARFSI